MIAVRPLLHYRGPYFSGVFLPLAAQLESLGADYMPFAFVLFDAAVGIQQTGRSNFSQPEDCYLTHLVGTVSNAGGCAVQLYDTLRQQLLEDDPMVFNNRFGTALRPFWLKRLYRLPANAQLQVKVTNLAPAAVNTIQLVGWGLRK
ncbi:MAG: hypothetical protein ACREVZ_00365 [Burkholderiales bacterium]